MKYLKTFESYVKEGVKKVTSNEMDAPEIEHETDESTGLPKDEYKSDPEIMEMVKRLSRGESAEKPKEENPEQVAGDSSESIERKKKALILTNGMLQTHI